MTTAAIFAALPVIAVVGLIASRRVSVLTAGFVGWLLATAEAVGGLFPRQLDFPTITSESLRSVWIAGQSVTVVAAGFFFFLAVRRRESLLATTATPQAFSHRRLWSICFLLGPVVESATGFGVGAIIAFPAILQMGLGGTPAVILALYSQILVPWGALAVGTVIGSALANVAPTVLSSASAVLTAPLLAGYLVLYWRFARAAGHPVPLRQKCDDAVWTLLLMLSIVAATRSVAVELGAIVPGGALLLLRWWRDDRPTLRRACDTALYIAPYVALIVALILTRSVPPVRKILKETLSFAPFPDLPDYAVLYNPSFWLIAAAISVFFVTRLAKEIPSAIAETVRRAWRPIALIVVFLALAQVLSSAEAAAAIGTVLKATLGNGAQMVAPLLGGLGGFLIGSTSASAGMMMPIQVALGIDNALWPAALQNTSASNFSLLSPSRVGMASALAGLSGGESAVYRRAWPIGAMLAVLLTIEAAIVVLLG